MDLYNQLLSFSNEEKHSLADCLVNRLLTKRYFPKPVFMELMLTEDCNLRCHYCFVKNKQPRTMSKEIAHQAVDFLIENSGKVKDLTILFFGGEPLLELEKIKEIIEYANEQTKLVDKTISYNTTTNGTLLDYSTALYLKRAKVKYLLSIDGLAETHDLHRRTKDDKPTFHLIEKNFPHLKRLQPWQGARYTIHPDHVKKMVYNIKELHKIGINQFIIGPAIGPDIPWNEEKSNIFSEQLDELVELYVQMKIEKKHFRLNMLELGDILTNDDNHSEDGLCMKLHENQWGCGAGRGRISVTTQGDLYGCSRLMTINGLKQEGLCKLGNIWDGFDPVARAKLARKYESGRPTCQSCEVKDNCTGGCPAVNYQYTGNMYKPSLVDCVFTKMYIRAREKAHKLMNKNTNNVQVTQEVIA